MSLEARIKEERLRLGMTQAQFGQLGGVGKTTQIKYESGASAPDAHFLAAVAAVGVDILYVVTGVRHAGTTLPESESLLLSRYRSATPDTQQAVCRVLDLNIATVSAEAARPSALRRLAAKMLTEELDTPSASSSGLSQLLVKPGAGRKSAKAK